MLSKLLILTILLSFQSVAQIPSDLEYKVITPEMVETDIENISNNFYRFVGNDFDSTDIEMLIGGPSFSIFVINALREDTEEELTYGTVYGELMKFKTDFSDRYEKTKSNFVRINPFKSMPATKANWENMRQAFLDVGEKEERITEADKLMQGHFDANKTLQEVLEEVLK